MLTQSDGDVLIGIYFPLDKHQRHQGYAALCRLSDRPGRTPQSVWSVSVPSTVDAALAPSGDFSGTDYSIIKSARGKGKLKGTNAAEGGESDCRSCGKAVHLREVCPRCAPK